MTQLFPGFADPLPFAPNPDPAWRTHADTAAAHIDALAKLAANPPWPAYSGGGGDGVLYVGGGKFWPGIAVGCRLLRELGYAGKIEVWHRGGLEPVRPEQVAGLGVTFYDSEAMAKGRGDARILTRFIASHGWDGKLGKSGSGWESKHYALTHTTLDHVLYLDADAYCVTNPQPLIDHTRGQFGYWDDRNPSPHVVKWLTVWPAGPGGTTPIQGGQLFIDRRACWQQLWLSHWMNQHSDYFYEQMFGDQDTWRVAFAAVFGRGVRLGLCDWQHPAFVCRWAGKPWVVHRCSGKLFLPEDSPADARFCSHTPTPGLPLESRVWELLGDVAADRKPEAVFGGVYRNRVWGDGSGRGSGGQDAKEYVWRIQTYAALAGWRSCTDAGCGDGRVLSQLPFERYHGADVHRPWVDACRAAFPQHTFAHADFFADRSETTLPPADVLLCRDVLHHWPTAMVRDWLRWATTCGRWKWVVACQDVHQVPGADDTVLGGWRPLHPEMEPLRSLGWTRYDQCRDKCLVVWKC